MDIHLASTSAVSALFVGFYHMYSGEIELFSKHNNLELSILLTEI